MPLNAEAEGRCMWSLQKCGALYRCSMRLGLSEMSLVETSFEIDLYSYERGCRQGSDVCQSSCPERYTQCSQ